MFQDFIKTFCPLPQPAAMCHFTRTLERRGASVGHSGVPIGTWLVAEENGNVRERSREARAAASRTQGAQMVEGMWQRGQLTDD